jgi:hypothetical protein
MCRVIEKDPAPFAALGAIHQGVGHALMAEEIPFAVSIENEGVVGKLLSSEALCVHHQLERFNPLNHRGSNTRIGSRGRPHSHASRDHSGGNRKQSDRAHLNFLPCNQLARNMRWFEPFVGGVCQSMASADVMAITKWSI